MLDALDELQRNILIGSLLGDGSLALYGRSKNAYYREHGGEKQNLYRRWKAETLSDINLKYYDKSIYGEIRSQSLPMLTCLYNIFYINKIKTVTTENIKLLSHAIGLACLYMDDGTLVIDSSIRKDGKYIFPRIAIYTLSFSKEENIILIEHIKQFFNIQFKLKTRPDGKKYIIELNKYKEVVKFIDLIKPYVSQIPCMNYKINLQDRLEKKINLLLKEKINVKIANLNYKENKYSDQDEIIIIQLKNQGATDKQIATLLDRSYWGVVDKIKRLRIENKL